MTTNNSGPAPVEKKDTVKEVLNIFNNGYNRQVILYGPPGTSKTYSSTLIAANILSGQEEITDFEEASSILVKNKDRFKLVQFHPSYNYEDFVRGISISIKDKQPIYNPVNKVFGEIAHSAALAYKKAAEEAAKKAAKKAAEDAKARNPGTDIETEANIKAEADINAEKFVLVIDEVNRAPLASVLGELIYGLEYRGEAITTPYNKLKRLKALSTEDISKDDEKADSPDDNVSQLVDTPLVVPRNLYIIGTMNTADRSIGSIDYAVRRRFAFVPLHADYDLALNTWNNSQRSANIKNMAKNLSNDIKKLFGEKENLEDPSIDINDIAIGHTYLLYDHNKCSDDEAAKKYLEHRLEYQIKPIIEEYVKDGLLKESIGRLIQNGKCNIQLNDKDASGTSTGGEQTNGEKEVFELEQEPES